MKRRLLFLCLVLLLSAFGCKRGEGPEEVAAVVNDEQITRAALIEAVLGRYGVTTLNELIVEKFIQQEAAKEGVSLTMEEEEKAFAERVIMAGGMENFQRFLANTGRTQEVYKEVLYAQVLLRKLGGKDLVITQEDMEAGFEQLYGERRTLQSISIRKAVSGELPSEEALAPEGPREEETEAEEPPPEQLRDAKAEIEEIRKELEAGADFTRIAVTRAEPLEARAAGGIVLEVPRGVLTPVWDEVVFSLEEGEISPVLEGEEAYHIFRVLSIIPAQEVKLQDKKEELSREIKERKAEAVAWELARRLQEESRVERYFPP